LSLRVALIVFGAVAASVVIGIASNNSNALMASTAAMVLSTLIFTALVLAKILEKYAIVRIKNDLILFKAKI
jgi:hypothetical protein